MSVQTEITRITNGKASIKQSLENKGATVPSNAKISDYSAIIDSLPSGGTGAYTGFDYDNWIAYGLTAPDPTKYKYWIPVDTTPQSKPLKYVAGYRIADAYTGELAALINDTTGSVSKTNLAGTAGCLQCSNNHSTYIYGNGGQQNTASSITLYRYIYTNQVAPSSEIGVNTEKLGTLATLFNTSTTLYISWTVHDNTIYTILGNTINAYDLTSKTSSQWARTSYTWMASSYRCLGLFYISSNQIIFLRTNTSGTNVNIISAYPGQNGSTNTLLSVNNLSGMTNYTSMRVDSDNILICYKASNFNMSNAATHKLMYNYRISTKTWTKITQKQDSGYLYWRWLVPENKLVFRYSVESNKCYELINGVFTEMTNVGNLFKVAFNSNTLVYLNGNTFHACIPANNFSIPDSEGIVHTYSFNHSNGASYNIVTGEVSKNYTFSHDIIENFDSTTNVLLPYSLKYESGSSIQKTGYKFFPRQVKDTYLYTTRSDFDNTKVENPKAIYNRTLYDIKISDGTQWLTSDPDNVII